MEFKELTKKDAQVSLAHELEKLAKTANAGEKQVGVEPYAYHTR